MKPRGFLLGLYSIGGQVLLLREMVSSLNGDELFIGTALFGWLVSVAVGAHLGGKARFAIPSGVLFLGGVVLLPLAIIATRLSPLMVTDIVGEVIPFSTAVLISIVMMLPVGLVSGWLFPSITREGGSGATSIVNVYLFEGIGAFVGGVMILVLVGGVFCALEMSIMLGIIVISAYLFTQESRVSPRFIITAVAAIGLFILTRYFAPGLDRQIDRVKYGSYQVERSFDTHYGHQAVLSRDGSLHLLTDNGIEAVCPDLETTENLLIPPLVYVPEAREILYVGRAEFTLAQLADSFPDLSITAVDPRRALSRVLDDIFPAAGAVLRIDDDPMAFLSRKREAGGYDIVILNPGEPGNYKNSRLLTATFFDMVRSVLKKDGVVFLPTRYDTDRYVTPEGKELLSIIYNALATSFSYVELWPGNMTLLFASDTPLFDVPYDSIIARLARLEYSPQYISEDYLGDRLDEYKLARLRAAVCYSDRVNTMDRPVLPHHQALYRAKANRADRIALSLILRKPAWVVAVPLLILLFFAYVSIGPARKKQRYGLFLYFTAGLASLSLELTSFYVYQSSAGSLFSEMAVLIGAFMLGLAFGTYYTLKRAAANPGYAALLTLLAATVIFLATCRIVQPQVQLVYHLLFLFTVATATGSLFVAATNLYYRHESKGNPGIGYAFELAGSSVGALFATTILLPVIGLRWLLLSLALLIVVAIFGLLVVDRKG